MMMTHHAGGISSSAHDTGNPHIDIVFRDDFRELVPMPADRAALAREIRFFQAYFLQHRLLQSAKWLGELLITVSNQSNYQISSKSGLAPFESSNMSEDHPMESDINNSNRMLFTDAADEILAQRAAHQ